MIWKIYFFSIRIIFIEFFLWTFTKIGGWLWPGFEFRPPCVTKFDNPGLGNVTFGVDLCLNCKITAFLHRSDSWIYLTNASASNFVWDSSCKIALNMMHTSDLHSDYSLRLWEICGNWKNNSNWLHLVHESHDEKAWNAELAESSLVQNHKCFRIPQANCD